MTTVRELIHELTADYVDLDAEVEIQKGDYDFTTQFAVNSIGMGGEKTVVRITHTYRSKP